MNTIRSKSICLVLLLLRPAVSHVRDRSGWFSALDSSLPLARSPWPKFRRNPRNTSSLADAQAGPESE